MKKLKQMILLAALTLMVSKTSALAELFTVSNDPAFPAQYTTVGDALVDANDGDTLLIKATRYSYGTVEISQPITILGEGYYPDKEFSYASQINIELAGGSSNTNIIGIYGSIGLAHCGVYCSPPAVDNVVIKRCALTSCRLKGNNCIIKHCTFNGRLTLEDPFTMGSISNCVFAVYNAGIWCRTNTGNSNVLIYNNVFFNEDGGLYFSENLNNATVRNNIIYGRAVVDMNGFSYVNFYNNLTFGASDNQFPDDPANNVYSTDNLENVDPKFVTADIPVDEDFSFNNDIHLQDGFPAKTGGSDGGEIGIYGGTDPWPEFEPNVPYLYNPIPPIPMVQRLHILNTPMKETTLKVKVKVKAVD